MEMHSRVCGWGE